MVSVHHLHVWIAGKGIDDGRWCYAQPVFDEDELQRHQEGPQYVNMLKITNAIIFIEVSHIISSGSVGLSNYARKLFP